MKIKTYFLSILLLFFGLSCPVSAQFIKLLDFDGTTNGQSPYGTLISDVSFLYGMTPSGGTNTTNCPNGCGTLFNCFQCDHGGGPKTLQKGVCNMPRDGRDTPGPYRKA